MLLKLREYFERFYPKDPIRISFSRFKIFLLSLVLLLSAGFIYLRSQNKTELQLLKQKHLEVQLAVKNYLNDMSRVNDNDTLLNELQSRVKRYKKQLNQIEEKIEDLKSFWFLE